MAAMKAAKTAKTKPARQAAGGGAHMATASVSVASPFGQGRDQVTMRICETVQMMRRRGDLKPADVRAAGWLRTLMEAASAGGTSAIDYGFIRVDTSFRASEVNGGILDAMGKLADVQAFVGADASRVLRLILLEGLTIGEVARKWPTVRLDERGNPDMETRRYVGRMMREALASVADRFCRGFDLSTTA